MQKQFRLLCISCISVILWVAIFSTVILAQKPIKKLPDLTIERILLGKDCNIIIEIKNNGPGIIPDNVWTVHSSKSSGVLLYKDGKRITIPAECAQHTIREEKPRDAPEE